MEHEIRKHTAKILSELRARKKSVWKRLGEISIEMLIIVFAVSFAAFIERSREHSHEQKEVKQFLLGLRTDLQNDIREMNEDKKGYTMIGNGFKYFAETKHYQADSLKKYMGVWGNTVALVPNDGRYEGFKASGKINTIENQNLRNAILDLYEETIKGLLNNTSFHNNIKNDLRKVSNIHMRRKEDGTVNFNQILQVPEVNNYCHMLKFTSETIHRYDTTIQQSKRIIEMIEAEYPELKQNTEKRQH